MTAAARQRLRSTSLFLFDLDGTLVDTLRVWNQMTHSFLQKQGLSATDEQIRAMDKMSFEEGSHHLRHVMGVPMTHEQFTLAWLEVAKELYGREARPVDGAVNTLQRLKARGARLVLFSQSPRPLVDEILPRMGLWHCFDGIFLSGETRAAKGSSEAVLEVLQKMGAAPAQAAVVDDAPYAVQAAREAGVLAIGAAWMSEYPEQLAQSADLVLDNIQQLL